jgi:hypothetical protein
MQNCPSGLIETFTVQLLFGSQDGSLVTDEDTKNATGTGIADVVLYNADDAAQRNRVGVILNKSYDTGNLAWDDIGYTYTVQLASADGSGDSSATSYPIVERFAFYEVEDIH